MANHRSVHVLVLPSTGLVTVRLRMATANFAAAVFETMLLMCACSKRQTLPTGTLYRTVVTADAILPTLGC